MPKMKQATLFSLKSWKTKPEDLIVYKKKLEKENTPETVILRTLALLNYATKESIVSYEIDKTLKFLAENRNMKIAMEAKLLIDQWGLSTPESHATKDSSQACAMEKEADIIAFYPQKNKSSIIDIHKTKTQTPSINKGESLSKSSHETLMNHPTIKVDPAVTWMKLTEKIDSEREASGISHPKQKNSIPQVDEFSYMKTSQLSSRPKTNPKTFSKSEIKAMKDRIETISKFFLETIGMQQVKFYLDH